ncbi:programmed cell death protein [Nowakowskiella sp. JEL0407]|nr:programmed cell death protein [Nowakowskiella sp. JEL0407]
MGNPKRGVETSADLTQHQTPPTSIGTQESIASSQQSTPSKKKSKKSKAPKPSENTSQPLQLFGSTADWGTVSFAVDDKPNDLDGFEAMNQFLAVTSTTTSTSTIPTDTETFLNKSETLSHEKSISDSLSQMEITPSIQSTSSEQHQQRFPHFPAHFITFAPDDSDTATADSYEHELALLKKYEKSKKVLSPEDGAGDGGEGWEQEGYEKVQPKFYNKGFKMFQREFEKNPGQLVRYEFNGTPLHYSASESDQKLTPPICPHCKSRRVFEFQLMPSVLLILPTEEYAAKRTEKNASFGGSGENRMNEFIDRYANGMEFGTVIVFSCERDCDGSGSSVKGIGAMYMEEYCVVQLESWQ